MDIAGLLQCLPVRSTGIYREPNPINTVATHNFMNQTNVINPSTTFHSVWV
jgi:hypothetical protein